MTTISHRTDRRSAPNMHAATEFAAADSSPRTTNLAAALLEFANRLIAAGDETVACRSFVEGIKELCELDMVAVGLTHSSRSGRIRAISGVAKFDPQADVVRLWEQRLEICLSKEDSTELTSSDGTHDNPWCVPLRSSDGRTLGASAIVFLPASDTPARRAIVRTALDVVAPIFEAAIELGRCRSVNIRRQSIGRHVANRQAWLLTAVAVAASFIPLPLPVRCECRVEPRVRRSVAVPYNAVWRKSLVRPGDVVAAGQSLGLLDDSELRRELAAATAERDRAAKSADVHAAAGKTAAAQIDRLEVRRIEERRALLTARLGGIDVQSPIAGIVLSGEWERAEGAPLKQGTVLFEIAPLDRVVVEAFVPEADLDRLAPRSEVTVVLDARHGAIESATIARIHPRAAVRDDANVFTAEIVLDNADGALRPGMQGHVDIATAPRSLARILRDRYRSLDFLSVW